jgi:signal transduction histidine kinase
VDAWLRRHPWQADGLLAVVVFAFSADQIPAGPASVRLAAVAVSALLAATVVPRRRSPLAAFTAAAAIGAAQIVAGLAPGGGAPRVRALEPTMTDLAIAVLLYTLAAHRPRRVSVAGLAACLLGSAVAIARWAPAHAAYPGGQLLAAAAGLGGAALTAWVLGDSVAYRYRRAYNASLEERAARLQAERDAQARIATAAERARELQERRARVIDESAARLRRIERDLHDGAQVRLAALAMSLGEVREDLAAGGIDRERTAMLVAAAHDNAKETLAELRAWPAVSTRRSWIAGSPPRCPRWPGPARSRSRSARARPDGPRRPSRPSPTSARPSCWPTWPSIAGRTRPRSASASRTEGS